MLVAPPRVLYVTADGSPAGGAIHVLQLLRGFQTVYELGIVTQRDSFLLHEAQALGVPAFAAEFFRSRLDLTTAVRLRGMVGRFDPGLVHVHGARAAFLYTAMRPARPSVHTVHGFRSHHLGRWRRGIGTWAERRIARRMDHTIFVSRYDAAVAARARLLPIHAASTVIPNGVDIREIPRAAERIGAAPPRVGFIGRLEDQKDPLLFVEVMRRLPGVAATMVGQGRLEAAVRAAASEAHVPVDFPGPGSRAAVLERLVSFTCLVMTSRWESLPLVALEAMGAGVPVVATAVGGLPELIANGTTGLLVRGRSADDLARAVRALLDDPALCARIGAAARERVAREFTAQRMLEQVRKVYESLQ